MNLTNCGCNSGCGCGSQVAVTPCRTDRCKSTLQPTELGVLAYLEGYDADLCLRLQRVADVLGLRDCAGNRISTDTPLVTCADFRAQLCAALSALAQAGEANASTLLVGADCRLYTVPVSGEVTETPNTATDTSSVDVTASGTLGRNISAAVRLSANAGNSLVIAADGLYVPPVAAPTTACQQLQAFPVGADAVPGTVLVGADCQLHTVPATTQITVTDTNSVDLTLAGSNLQADVRLGDFIGRMTGDGLELLCQDVLACAPPVTVLDTSTVDLTLTGQQLSAAVIVSPNAGNDLQALPSGLYLDVCEELQAFPAGGTAVPGVTELIGANCSRFVLPTLDETTVGDTTSINLTLTGTNITGVVNLQPNTLLELGPQGLQVTCEAVQDCIFTSTNNFWSYNDVTNSVSFFPSADLNNQLTLGSDGRPFVAPSGISVADTACINMSLVGNVISAVPVISALPGNGIQCIGDGLFAPDNTDIDLTGLSSPCIQVSVSEPIINSFEITAVPIISVDAGNTLECRGNGLYASAADTPITPVDTLTVDLTVNGLENHTIQADVRISPLPENSIQTFAGGIFVLNTCGQIQSFPDVPIDPATARVVYEVDVGGGVLECFVGQLPPQPEITVVDSACVNLTVTEPTDNTFELTADLLVSPDAGNVLECRINGAYVPAETSTTIVDKTVPADFTRTVLTGVLDAGTVFGEIPLLVTNPSPNRSMVVNFSSIGEPSILWDLIGASGTVRIESVLFVETSIDNGATWDRQGSISNTSQVAAAIATDGLVNTTVSGMFSTNDSLVLAPGASETVRVRYTSVVAIANATPDIVFTVNRSRINIIGHTV